MTAVSVGARRESAADAALDRLHGRQVARFRLAGGSHRGAIGPVEGEIIERVIRLGTSCGVPIIGELDTGGADVNEGLGSLHAWGKVARALTEASGVVPIFLSVTGPCLAGPALMLGLADHVVMTADSYAYVSGPQTVLEFTGVATTSSALGGSDIHARQSGLVSLVVADADAANEAVADLLSYLPSNYLASPPTLDCDDPVDRPCRVAETAVPDRATASYDVRTVVGDVVDRDSFLEVRAASAPNVVTGYAHVGGHSVGVIANQPSQKAGSLDIEASRKAARFVQSCDAFGLGLVTFVDSSGFYPGRDLEWRGMIRHGAQLVSAYASATVPRVCVVLRKAYGGAFIVMDSRGLGNDVCLAWPRAEIAVMGAPGAVQVLRRRELNAIADVEERAAQQLVLETEYSERFCTPSEAAARGFVDDVIEPVDTRRAVAAALACLRTKRAMTAAGPARHSNPPL